jgi:DNA-directed RNA polymerase subunit RPC12/RpoP
MNSKLLIIKCPQCGYNHNIGKKEENFKVYEAEYEYPYIRCPKCKYKESVL